LKIFDLNQLEQDSSIEVDLIVVGSGPAGLSIANEFARTRVLVLEGGGLEDEADTQSLYEIESTGAPRVLRQDNIRRRILGGSSHVWTGRCAPFDSFDYEQRPWVPYSGWPLTGTEMEPYLERAAYNLGAAPNRYDESLWQAFRVNPPKPPLSDRGLRAMFWQFSTSWTKPDRPAHFGRDLVHAEAPNVEILLHANVTHINLSGDGSRFESVDVRTLQGKRACVGAKAGPVLRGHRERPFDACLEPCPSAGRRQPQRSGWTLPDGPYQQHDWTL
jgi:choline dehydrogenase-like flavoprotein